MILVYYIIFFRKNCNYIECKNCIDGCFDSEIKEKSEKLDEIMIDRKKFDDDDDKDEQKKLKI